MEHADAFRLYPKPTPPDERGMKVFTPGPMGVRRSDHWIFHGRDDGAFLIKLHRGDARDGLVVVLELQTGRAGSIHPYTIVVDRAGESWITHHRSTVASVTHEPGLLATNRPTWVWVRFFRGTVAVGLGTELDRSYVMRGTTDDELGGGYLRFGVGKTDNHGAFELLDVQPLELRRNRNLYGAGF